MKLFLASWLFAGVAMAGPKLVSLKVVPSETKFTWDFGGGVSFGAGPANFFAEIRYVSIQESGGSTKFVPITVGVAFGAGKK